MDALIILSKVAKRLNARYLAFSLMKVMPIMPPPAHEKLHTQNIEKALDLLHSISPDNGGSSHSETATECRDGVEYDLDIIIPVYNVKQYVEQCVDSVLAQKTRFSFHVTIINDGSTDGSRDKLKKYENDPRLTILDQINKGFSGARNTGVANVKGRYITFVDSDDRLPKGAIETLMTKAEEGNFDIVGGGYARFDSRRILNIYVPRDGQQTGFVWGKLYKAKVWEDIRFPEGYWFEDTVFAFLFNNSSRSKATVKQVVYDWRRNTASISFSSKGRPKILDTVYVTLQLLKDRENLGLPHDDDFRRMLLYQFKVNAVRVYSLGNKQADYANFIICRQLYDKYNLGKVELGGYYKEVSKALAKNNYKLFMLACLFL